MECEGFLPQVLQGVGTNASIGAGECDTLTVLIQPTGTFPLSTQAASESPHAASVWNGLNKAMLL